jgi:hypothetical protein
MKKLLFISWDSDSSNYLEALFFPIFNELSKIGGIEIHVMQFSWAKPQEVSRIKQIAHHHGISYSHIDVNKDKWGMIGMLNALFVGSRKIKYYINKHQITHLMPRSTMPALICNRMYTWLKNRQIALIFDADGLPLEERLDYTNLTAKSLQYKFLKAQETKMLIAADSILVRSKAAITYHRKRISQIPVSKFHIVSNGRDESLFDFKQEEREQTRKILGLNKGDQLFVYTGSLGIQYAFDEMLRIFTAIHTSNPNVKFLLLTRMPVSFPKDTPPEVIEKTIFLQKDFKEVPRYLAAADFAFCLRLPAPSLAGIAPIKLGEYLMMGLPTIISKGIGDIEMWSKELPFLHTYDHTNANRIEEAINWMTSNHFPKKPIIDFGKSKFGLHQTAQQYERAMR